MSEKIRLNKFLAERLMLSRREADEEIKKGKVKIDGRVAIIGDRVDKNNEVWYNNIMVPFLATFSYYLFHKPVGYVCSRRAQGENPTIYDLLPKEMRKLKTVGRLDKDSSGLILLTDDGDFAFKMTHPSFKKVKVYEVELDRALAPLHQQMLADFGVNLTDGPSKIGLMRLDEERKKWEVILTEGRNRQIRRSFGALGYRVEKLYRREFGKYQIENLKVGEFKQIENKSIINLS